ncbi:hypothetical protein [Megamonas funiformis]|uniref:hypothetical protein n=1 Tax=Megamonas funiformis TaxID=437897 RepID=UPI001CC58028|nr:hypothetical protein [Megamonas funiformis]
MEDFENIIISCIRQDFYTDREIYNNKSDNMHVYIVPNNVDYNDENLKQYIQEVVNLYLKRIFIEYDAYKFKVDNIEFALNNINNLTLELNRKNKEIEQLRNYLIKIESRLNTLEKENINIKLAKKKDDNYLLEQKINQLEKENAILRLSYKKDREEIDLLKKKIVSLEKVYENNNQELIEKDNRNEFEIDNEEVKAFCKADNIIVSDINNKKDINEGKLIQQYDIEKFNLNKTDDIFLGNDISMITSKLEKAMNVSGIIEVLGDIELENREVFIKLFNKYQKNLKKLIDNLEIDEEDEDIIFEKITEKFLDILKRDILDNVLIAIYRSMKNNNQKELYEKLLMKINEYLISCSIYTRYIVPNRKYTELDLKDMEPLAKKQINKKKMD